MTGIRLSKLMAQRGMCSRREADRLIERGHVRVDGQTVTRLGTRIDPESIIVVTPAARAGQRALLTVLLNKPPGVVSNQPEKKYQEAIEVFKQTASICPFDTGQLDKLKQRVAKEGFKLVQESILYMGCAATHLSKLVEELDEGQKNQVPVDHELLKIFKEWNNAS